MSISKKILIAALASAMIPGYASAKALIGVNGSYNFFNGGSYKFSGSQYAGEFDGTTNPLRIFNEGSAGTPSLGIYAGNEFTNQHLRVGVSINYGFVGESETTSISKPVGTLPNLSYVEFDGDYTETQLDFLVKGEYIFDVARHFNILAILELGARYRNADLVISGEQESFIDIPVYGQVSSQSGISGVANIGVGFEFVIGKGNLLAINALIGYAETYDDSYVIPTDITKANISDAFGYDVNAKVQLEYRYRFNSAE